MSPEVLLSLAALPAFLSLAALPTSLISLPSSFFLLNQVRKLAASFCVATKNLEGTEIIVLPADFHTSNANIKVMVA